MSAKPFLQVLKLAEKAGLAKLGHVALDGNEKIRGNASEHKAMSYERMKTRETELRAGVDRWLDAAQAADAQEDRLHGVIHPIHGVALPSGRASLSAFGFGKRRRAAMGYYVGLDVSLKSTHICVLDGERRVVWRGVSDTQIAMVAEHLARWGKQIVLVGLETGSLTPWLYHGLSDLGLPMVCMDARRASDALELGRRRRTRRMLVR